MKHELLEEDRLYEVKGLTENWKLWHEKQGKLFIKISRNSIGLKTAEFYNEAGQWVTTRNILLADKQFEVVHDSKKATGEVSRPDNKPKSPGSRKRS